MEGKYGRLFTETDVKLALAHAIEEAWNSDEGVVGGPTVASITERVLGELPTTFAPDEPLFLLRGQDSAAPEPIAHIGDGEMRDYESMALGEGCSREFAIAVRNAAEGMREWQAAHPDRVKVPD